MLYQLGISLFLLSHYNRFVPENVVRGLETEIVAQDVEGGGDVVEGDGLVDAVVADGGEQGAGDFAAAAFLVVAHQC